ncbi:zinc ribbon domain-containing protein [Streptomyces sp. NPDC127079]|uniref:zinc ribbon domain-containing protein n=1 Tax=Streptomyces sp. NPDC127079 TaxID=3347132 RepID=UPI00365B8D05
MARIAAETPSAVGRTRLAKSVHDAGWSAFAGMLAYKAVKHGRTFAKVDRAFPSSQVCSVRGFRDGPKPLHVREWTCGACGTVHDRDHNAARDVLCEGRRIVATGRVETPHACGVRHLIHPQTHRPTGCAKDRHSPRSSAARMVGW